MEKNNSDSNQMMKLLVLILLTTQMVTSQVEPREEFLPVWPAMSHQVIEGGGVGQRRRLTPFRLCLACKCCSTATCATMPCCFGIDCQLPNKPFGVCAFGPLTCNCTDCAV